jgi:hypothetical protein
MKFVLGVALAAEGVVVALGVVSVFAHRGQWLLLLFVVPLIGPTAIAAGIVLAFDDARRR